MRWLLLAVAISCSGGDPELPEPSDPLASAILACDLETLYQESARARIDMQLHYFEPKKAYSARWRWRLVWKSIEWCGSKT